MDNKNKQTLVNSSSQLLFSVILFSSSSFLNCLNRTSLGIFLKSDMKQIDIIVLLYLLAFQLNFNSLTTLYSSTRILLMSQLVAQMQIACFIPIWYCDDKTNWVRGFVSLETNCYLKIK
jgi:hypothetical protein